MDRESGVALAILYEYDHDPEVDLADSYFPARLAAYSTLRYYHLVEARIDPSVGLLGVQVVHHPRRGRRYNFVLIESCPSAIASGSQEVPRGGVRYL